MKSFEKIWKTEYRGINIEVHNSWDMEHIGEAVYINGNAVYRRNVPLDSVKLSSMMGQWLEFEENGVHITVKLGSAWHFFGIACQILINGKYHSGNRIVWFTKKP